MLQVIGIVALLIFAIGLAVLVVRHEEKRRRELFGPDADDGEP